MKETTEAWRLLSSSEPPCCCSFFHAQSLCLIPDASGLMMRRGESQAGLPELCLSLVRKAVVA